MKVSCIDCGLEMRCPSCGGRPLVTSAVQANRNNERAASAKALAAAQAECERLRAWKAEAIAVETGWDAQAIATMLGGRLGTSCRKTIAEKVPLLIAENERLREMRVSIPLTHAEVEALRPERLNAIGEMRGWNVGFPAGFAAGARAFAKYLEEDAKLFTAGALDEWVDDFVASQRGDGEEKEG